MKLRTGIAMSTFLLMLGIALLTPTTKSYGQLTEQENILSMHIQIPVSYILDFNSESSGIEHWMTVPFESSYAGEELELESWMTVPFEVGIVEDELMLEDWMASSWC